MELHGHPSVSWARLQHLADLKLTLPTNLPQILVQFLCTQCLHPEQKIHLLPAPDQQTSKGHIPESNNLFIFWPLNITLAFFMFTINPLFSKLTFQDVNLQENSSTDLVITHGSCSLHMVNVAFKRGAECFDWKIKEALKAAYQILNNASAGREDYL